MKHLDYFAIGLICLGGLELDRDHAMRGAAFVLVCILVVRFFRWANSPIFKEKP